jgi:hypothetical protein
MVPMNRDMSLEVQEAARRYGADLVGIVRAADLPEHREELESILPGAQSVVVVAVRHSLAALRSSKLQMGQFWQTFMTGNYYYCIACQAQCPAAQLPG